MTKPTSASPLDELVLQALRHWHDLETDAGMLTDLLLHRIALQQGAGSPRQANNQVLRQAFVALRGQHAAAAADLLELRFADCWPVDEVAIRLNFAASTVLRRQHEAVLRLAAVLHDLERATWQKRTTQIESRIDAPAYSQLVGVDSQVVALAELISQDQPPWLVSIEGIGGIGKTVLADALVRRVGHSLAFDDFAWASAQPAVLDLRGTIRAQQRPALSSAALVTALLQQLMPEAATGVLGMADQAFALLRERLKQAPHLVVIDNLETVADLEALIPALQKLANPTKFVLTTRKRLIGERDIYLYPVPELSPEHAFALVRQTAQAHNAAELATASDSDLEPLYATVGGNPLALLLVVGQVQRHGLDTVVEDLQRARGAPVESLYTFIYRRGWDALDELGRHVLLAMALVKVRGDSLDFIAATSGIPAGKVHDALDQLITLNLVQSAGDLRKRRYLIHSLTRTFLLEQVARWQ